MAERAAHFGQALVRLRKAQHFAAPYAFYKARGGARVFGLSFANYLNLEKGRSLPRGSRVERLLEATGHAPGSPAARELLYAYFRDVLGSDKLLGAWSASPRTDPAPPGWQAAELAARQAIQQRSVQLTLEQYEALVGDPLAYGCHVILANTRGWLSPLELCGMLRAGRAKVATALRRLGTAGLAECASGKARSPLAGKYVVPPVVSPATVGIYARLQAYRNDWEKRHGHRIHQSYLTLRASRKAFADYLPHLSDVVALSAVYGDVAPGPDSELYLVESRVTRVFGGDDTAR